MDVAAAILIGCGIIVGGVMATRGLKGEHIPKGLAILHGIFVASGLILLLIYALTTESHHRHWDSVAIFIVAATGGFYMLTRDLRMKGIPPWLLIVHALLGLGGFVWLMIHLLN